MNLSSSDEEDALEEWNQKQHSKKSATAVVAALGVATAPAAAAYQAPALSRHSGGDILENDFDKELEVQDDSDESVEWEDGHEDESGAEDGSDDDRKPAAVENPTQPKLRQVTVNLGVEMEEQEGPPPKKRKVKTRKKFRHDSLPRNLQSLLTNLHRTHLLALTCQAFGISQQANDPELLAVSLSLVPDELYSTEPKSGKHFIVPAFREVKRFCDWYFSLVHEARMRRQAQLRAHRAAGAPVYRRRRQRRQSQPKDDGETTIRERGSEVVFADANSTHRRLLSYALYLANSISDDPRYEPDVSETQEHAWSDLDKCQLMIAMIRSMGWRCRFAIAMDPVSPDLDLNHPILAISRNVFESVLEKKSKRKQSASTPSLEREENFLSQRKTPTFRPAGWVEILCAESQPPNRLRWIHVDPSHQLLNQADQVEALLLKKRKETLAYVTSVEHSERGARFADVTPRYASSFVGSLRRRGVLRGRGAEQGLSLDQVRRTWWHKTIHSLNLNFHEQGPQGRTQEDAIAIDSDSEEGREVQKEEHVDEAEEQELRDSALNEAIPTSKTAFKTHPMYVIKSVLGNAEVLVPDAAKRVCGMFKGQAVYRRTDVVTAHPARKWPYLGRKVRGAELNRPIKRVKARKKPVSTNFKPLQSYGVGASNDGSEERRVQDIQDANKPLEDGTDALFGLWQTDAWSPSRVGPMDAIPVNEYKNVELELLNPGLVHIDQRGIAKVAKKLGIPYAPCMLGFEGQGGRRVPTVRGIVVHMHNEQLLREASLEMTSYLVEQETTNRRRVVYGRWKRLLVGLLTKDRLDREYG